MSGFTISLTHFKCNLLRSPCQWLDSIEIHNSNLARLLCMTIPARCPFEREIKLCDRIYFPNSASMQIEPFLRTNNWSTLQVLVLFGR
ncbi:MAG: hypothetical protein CLLPBCKN_000836 [Chroococcidiopsis cubana SAG 39.79]|nr:Mo-dependent nitrogenase C-terminal domain-containing protein [Chroococcidiopsis cubana]MDZ4871448.1 hypothetical protein [Chroococcidiopsis cubana SAG 39.79]